jgi:hypothetical protein
VGVVAAIFGAVDLYCAIRRDWSFAAAEVDGDGEKHESESGEEVCGEYADEEEGVRGACMTWISMFATGEQYTRARLDCGPCLSSGHGIATPVINCGELWPVLWPPLERLSDRSIN